MSISGIATNGRPYGEIIAPPPDPQRHPDHWGAHFSHWVPSQVQLMGNIRVPVSARAEAASNGQLPHTLRLPAQPSPAILLHPRLS